MEKIISHRGNLYGVNDKNENTLTSINYAISNGFDVEIDLWGERNNNQTLFQTTLWLGHDFPINKVDISWLYDRINYLWIHCKNLEALSFFSFYEAGFNYFWHQSDYYTLTSRGYTIAYPGLPPHEKTIVVHNDGDIISKNYLDVAYGVITDHPILFKNTFKNNKL